LHVAIGPICVTLQRFDDARDGQVHVVRGVGAMRQVPLDEEHTKAASTPIIEHVEWLAQVGRLLVLIADVVAREWHRHPSVVPDHLSAAAP
jgi:hypothetical protein